MKSINLEILTSPGCKICHSFLEFWKTAAKDWSNVNFKEVSIVTPEGQELAQKHMIFASPGIILNGELFSTGGFNQKDFLEKLKELSKD